MRGSPTDIVAAGSCTAVLAPAGLLHLQRTAGNAAVCRLLGYDWEAPRPLRGGGEPLEPALRAEMEGSFGTDFSSVRVHRGLDAERSAAAFEARAYTVGEDVVLGEAAPERRTLAHELAHVVQQRVGPVDGNPIGDGVRVSDPGDRFEQTAETVADRLVAAAPAPVVPGVPSRLQRRASDGESGKLPLQELALQRGEPEPDEDEEDEGSVPVRELVLQRQEVEGEAPQEPEPEGEAPQEPEPEGEAPEELLQELAGQGPEPEPEEEGPEETELEEEGPEETAVQELALQRRLHDPPRRSLAPPLLPRPAATLHHTMRGAIARPATGAVQVQRAPAAGLEQAEAFEALLDEIVARLSAPQTLTPAAIAERAETLMEVKAQLGKPGLLRRLSRWVWKRPSIATKLTKVLRMARMLMQASEVAHGARVPTPTPPAAEMSTRPPKTQKPPVAGGGPEPPPRPGAEAYKRVGPRGAGAGEAGFATTGAIRGMGLGFIYGWVLEHYIDLIRAGLGNVQQRARFGLPLSWKQQQELLESQKSASDTESLRRHYQAIAKERGISVEEAEKQELEKQAKTRHLVRKEMTIKGAP